MNTTIMGIDLLNAANVNVYSDHATFIMLFIFFFIFSGLCVLYVKFFDKSIREDIGFEIILMCSSLLFVVFSILLAISSYQYNFNHDYLVLKALKEITTQELVDYGYE